MRLISEVSVELYLPPGIDHLHVLALSVPQETLERLRETFRRVSTSSGYLPQATFVRDVLGETVPSKLTDVSY